jgi:hypothetical protein
MVALKLYCPVCREELAFHKDKGEYILMTCENNACPMSVAGDLIGVNRNTHEFSANLSPVVELLPHWEG